MDRINTVSVFGIIIYLNSCSGLFSDAEKDVISEDEIPFEDAIQNYTPKTVNLCINISNSCNLNCSYCFNKNKTNEMINIEKVIDYIDYSITQKFNQCEKYYIDLSGKGEPLLNKKAIFKIKDHCNELSNKIRKEIVVQFVCNGTLLTKNAAAELKEKEILFGISIDGSKKNHDLYRKDKNGKKSYNLIIKNVKNIENRDFLGAALTINNHIFSLWKTIDNLKKLFPTISIKPVRGKGVFDKNTISKWCNEYSLLAKKMIKEIKKKDFSTLFCLLNGDDYFGKFIKRIFLNEITITRCDNKISRYTLDTNGKIKGCPPSFTYIKNYETHNLNEELSKHVQENLDYCSNCTHFLFCGGECPIERKLNNGNNAVLCILKKHLINLSMYLNIVIKKNYPVQFDIILDKCNEIRERDKADAELSTYASLHPETSFTDCQKIIWRKRNEKQKN